MIIDGREEHRDTEADKEAIKADIKEFLKGNVTLPEAVMLAFCFLVTVLNCILILR